MFLMNLSGDPRLRFLVVCGVLLASVGSTWADDVIHRYEGNIVPGDPASGWSVFDPCETTCGAHIESGQLVLEWAASDTVNFSRWISQPPDTAPLTLWSEWGFRSDVPRPAGDFGCDGFVTVRFRELVATIFLHGDSAVSFRGTEVVSGLELNALHTYRFESEDGLTYRFSVDGRVFTVGQGTGATGFHYLQFGGRGQCRSPEQSLRQNGWDFVRYGTIGYGESIVATDPPGPATGGFLDARVHAPLDRFTVTFDQPNYVYVDEIAVEATDGVAPAVVATRRQDNGPPETVEIVLDQPIPYNATTRFTFNDGTLEQTVELTYAPGDTDGDGDADLADLAALQNCFGEPTTPGVCASLDRDGNAEITLTDFAAFQNLFAGQ